MIITPTHVRFAFQSAAGRDLKFPSREFEEYVAKFLNGLRDVTPVCNHQLVPTKGTDKKCTKCKKVFRTLVTGNVTEKK